MVQEASITIADLKQDPENARAHNPRNIGMITTALHEVGAARSIVIDSDNVILAGNGVYEAAVEAGIQNVQIVEADGETIIAVKRSNLTDEQKRRLAYFDNRTAELADWNTEQIIADFEKGLDLEGIFRDDELKEMLEGFADGLLGEDAPEPQIDKAEELRQKWGVEIGDLWMIPSQKGDGEHRIVCGDCTDVEVVERVMGGEKAEMGLHDPPYGADVVKVKGTDKKGSIGGPNWGPVGQYPPVIGDDKPFDPSHLLGLGEVIVLWGANYYADRLPISSGWLVWDKREGTPSNNFADCELAWVSKSIPARLFAHKWMGMVKASEHGQARYHPTQKPVALFEWVLDLLIGRSDVVLDCYVGSGTTLVACERLGRFGRGIEISPGYVAVSLQRLADMGLEPEQVSL